MSLLVVNDLSLSFGGLSAVSRFNLTLQSGEVLGIIGPNGAGKTTVFNLITGIYRPTAGTITFDGVSISGLPPDRITSLGVARTFQNIRLFDELTVLDNIRIGHYAKTHYSPLDALLHTRRYMAEERRILESSFHLLGFFRMEQMAWEIARNLPYGFQRRLEMARALATGPKLLLLDEPAAGMNPREIDDLMESVQSVRRVFGVTVLLIEHQMQLVMGTCDRIIVLDFGETIAEGAPGDIRNNPMVLEAYLGRKAASKEAFHA